MLKIIDKSNKFTAKSYNIKIILCELALSFMISSLFYVDSKKITYDSICYYLDENDYLSENDKELYKNQKLLDDILPYYRNTRMEFKANSRFNNLHYKYYKKRKNVLGYYDCNNPNVINLKQGNKNVDYVKVHEYIHLLQSNYKYLYISEACADIISEEYYDISTDIYLSATINTKILMEIMGPEIIWNLNFGNSDKEFVSIIKDNLDDDKANKLLMILSQSPDSYDNINDDIRALLNELYFNIYETNLEDNLYIKYITNNTLIDRYYFNEDKILQYTPFYVDKIKIFLIKKKLSYREYIEYIENNGDLKLLDIVWKVENDKNNYYIEDAIKNRKVDIYYEEILCNLTEEEQKSYINKGYMLKSFRTDYIPEELTLEIKTSDLSMDELSEKYNLKYLPNIYENNFLNNKESLGLKR